MCLTNQTLGNNTIRSERLRIAIEKAKEARYIQQPLLRPTGLFIKKHELIEGDLNFAQIPRSEIEACYRYEVDRQTMLDDYAWHSRIAKSNKERPPAIPAPFSIGGQESSYIKAAYARPDEPVMIFWGEEAPNLRTFRRIQFSILASDTTTKNNILSWWIKYGNRKVENWLKTEVHNHINLEKPKQGSRQHSQKDLESKLLNLLCYRLARAGLNAAEAVATLRPYYEHSPMRQEMHLITQDERTYGRRIKCAHKEICQSWSEQGRTSATSSPTTPRRRPVM